MSNALYTSYRNRLAGSGTQADTDWDNDIIKVHLVDNADYTFSAAHDFENDITDAGIVATATLASVTIGSVGAGVVDAADTTFTSVTGDVSESLVLWHDTAGADTTDPLLVYFDTFSSGMPVTPNGGNVVVVWNASGIIGF